MIDAKQSTASTAEERQADLENRGEAETYKTGNFAKQFHTQKTNEGAAAALVTGRQAFPKTAVANARAGIAAKAPKQRLGANNRSALGVEQSNNKVVSNAKPATTPETPTSAA
jgi:hypothetical protein